MYLIVNIAEHLREINSSPLVNVYGHLQIPGMATCEQGALRISIAVCFSCVSVVAVRQEEKLA